MNLLVNIAVFGIVGAVVMAALVGLLLVAAGRATTASTGTLGAACVALLLAVPALAAGRTLGAEPAAGAGQAFLVATAVVIVIYAAGAALLPMVARQAAAVRGQAVPRGLALTPAIAAGGLLVCAALGAAGTGIALLLA